ncbi:hypothetical protein C1646_775621 [Rhizophagus diaphanus]|nr:hypothetical protein C1646_775621 [Rhizophagus diaphanus] [Rhizophagus sp. MUCL 43196]
MDKHSRHYHLVGSFDNNDFPELPLYQTGKEIYWTNSEDTQYGYSKLPPDELLMKNLLKEKQIKDTPTDNSEGISSAPIFKLTTNPQRAKPLIITLSPSILIQIKSVKSLPNKSANNCEEVGNKYSWIEVLLSSNSKIRASGILGETVEMIAQRIMQDSLSKKEVKAIAKALTSPNFITTTSCLSRLRRKLQKLNAPEKIISATYDEKTTCASNKIQKERRVQRENEEIDFPDHFLLESVKERLNLYDISKTPTVQALADQDNPQVFRSLERDEERAKLLLTWIQDAISSGQLRDPGVPGVKWFNTFLKKDRFLSETSKPLLSSYLRKLEAVFAVISNSVKNLSDAITIAITDQNHSSNSMSTEQKVIRYMKILAQAFRLDKQNAEVYSALFSENRALKKQLEDYHSQYNTLEKRVKRLERNVKSLKTELEDLNEYVELDECKVTC